MVKVVIGYNGFFFSFRKESSHFFFVNTIISSLFNLLI